MYYSTIADDMMIERDELLEHFDSKISFDQETLYNCFEYKNKVFHLTIHAGMFKARKGE